MHLFTQDRNPYNALLDLQLPISSNIDDEATHEVTPTSLPIDALVSLSSQLYLWGFAEAVRVGVSFVMWCVLRNLIGVGTKRLHRIKLVQHGQQHARMRQLVHPKPPVEGGGA